MELIKTSIESAYIIQPPFFSDQRGGFVKTIHADTFKQWGLDFQFTESFYSISKKNVLRGMHFQYPPFDHDKLVYVVKGKILDVIVDIRKGSSTYGTHISIELSEENRRSVFLGKGLAHGFLSLEDDSIVEYHTTTVQNKECEGGILWNSFGMDWGINNPVMSERDKAFLTFSEFTSK